MTGLPFTTAGAIGGTKEIDLEHEVGTEEGRKPAANDSGEMIAFPSNGVSYSKVRLVVTLSSSEESRIEILGHSCLIFRLSCLPDPACCPLSHEPWYGTWPSRIVLD